MNLLFFLVLVCLCFWTWVWHSVFGRSRDTRNQPKPTLEKDIREGWPAIAARRQVDWAFNLFYCLALVFSLMAAATRTSAEETNQFSLGARSGFSSTDFGHPFWQTEAFGTYDWRDPWRLISQWTLRPRLEATVGDLSRQRENGFIGTMGPELVLRHGQWPVTVDAGIRVTILSRMAYGDRDFGYPLQFTSHVGLDWEICSRWKLGYRFQHMSNAGLGSSNPGLNTHLFGLAYQF